MTTASGPPPQTCSTPSATTSSTWATTRPRPTGSSRRWRRSASGRATTENIDQDIEFLRISAPGLVDVINLIGRLGAATPGDRLIDVGSGSGWGSWLFAEAGYDPWMVDFEPNSLWLGGLYEHPRMGPGKRIVGDATLLPFADATFGVALVKEFAHHVADKDRLFAEVNRVLRPGGLVVLIEPTHSLWMTVQRLRGEDPDEGHSQHELTWRETYVRALARNGMGTFWQGQLFHGGPGRMPLTRTIKRRSRRTSAPAAAAAARWPGRTSTSSAEAAAWSRWRARTATSTVARSRRSGSSTPRSCARGRPIGRRSRRCARSSPRRPRASAPTGCRRDTRPMDGHDHDHDHSELSETQIRVRALESVLVEKGYVDPAALDELVETYETKVGPHNGARVVAKSWVDPDYRRWLFEDSGAAIGSLGYTGRQGENLLAVENTPQIHNMVVCTLCSCYPWPVLGLPPVWYKAAPYRSRAVADPRGVLRDFGVELPADTEIRVWDSTAELRYLVIPMRPEGTDGWSEEELAELVTRDAMIGTGLARTPSEATRERRPRHGRAARLRAR